ncbi:hypothetical protein R4P64_30260 [Rhodococcus sp. IEGM 1366]|nr:hypothetical protein [Rhodococcus sp. IEGM 1366]MDV8070812.1 hypothetical protein [Rhodococcus sp. IEGM 1366]
MKANLDQRTAEKSYDMPDTKLNDEMTEPLGHKVAFAESAFDAPEREFVDQILVPTDHVRTGDALPCHFVGAMGVELAGGRI